MGTLKDWNEGLVAYFLNHPSKKILFNVTQDVISSIHNSDVAGMIAENSAMMAQLSAMMGLSGQFEAGQ